MIWSWRHCGIADRMDLVGFDEKCLIRPRKLHSEKMQEKNGYSGRNHGGTGAKEQNPNGNNKIQERQTEIIKIQNAGHKNTKPASTGNGAEVSPRQDCRKGNPSVMYTNGK